MDVAGPRSAIVAFVAASLILTACDPDPAEPTPDTDASVEQGDGPVADSEPTDDGAGTDEQEMSEPPVQVNEAPPRFAYPEAGTIELTTPGAGGGPWPVLAWEAVPGAETYSVTLFTTSGPAYWRWRGDATEVRVGGFVDAPAPDSTIGPRVDGNMTWDVIARDAGGSVIAQSGERPIAP